MNTFINIDLLIDFMEEDRPGCFNGAYVGDDYWEQERYTDLMLRRERRAALRIEGALRQLKIEN